MVLEAGIMDKLGEGRFGDLPDPLEMGSERKGRPQQVFYSRAVDGLGIGSGVAEGKVKICSWPACFVSGL